MKSGNLFIIALLSGVMLTGAGCSWFDNEIPANNNQPIPGAAPDIEFEGDGGTTSNWIKGIDTEPIGGMTKDGWKPVTSVTLPTVYFAYDQSAIGASERHKLQQVSEYLKQNPTFGLIIEGHCDEKGSAEYNRALGERRAIAVQDFLVNTGVSSGRIKTISYGEDRPAVSGSDENSRAKNRRGELILARMQ
jgi:peptidoglycan-associated lipoprotein